MNCLCGVPAQALVKQVSCVTREKNKRTSCLLGAGGGLCLADEVLKIDSAVPVEQRSQYRQPDPASLTDVV